MNYLSDSCPRKRQGIEFEQALARRLAELKKKIRIYKDSQRRLAEQKIKAMIRLAAESVPPLEAA